MAAATGTEQGKTSFVEEFLKDHEDADLAAVNAAWRSFGREGTISESLFGKTRRSLGLTRKRDGKKPKAAGGTPAVATSAAVRKGGKKATTRGPIAAIAGEVLTQTSDRNQMLIALEKDLDRLLFGVLEMESMTEVEEFIRSARRVVSREIR
jgi:hypothetical protein